MIDRPSPRRRYGAVSRSYLRAEAREAQAEWEAALERARKRQLESEDVRPVDPWVTAVSGLCIVVLVGGLAVSSIVALWRWIAEVAQ